MEITRRTLIQSGITGAALLGGTWLTGCSTAGSTAGAGNTAASSASLSFWIWPDGISKHVVAAAKSHFAKTSLRQSLIGGDFKQKLTTTFQGRHGIPDITGVKGEDMPYFLSEPDLFLDLNTLGADKLKDRYVDWKWASGSTPDGKLIGFPMDIGPTALFYRRDVFKRAGLPYTPEDLATHVDTWEHYFELGKQLKAAHTDSFLIRNAEGIMSMVMGQGTKQFINKSNTFIGDQAHVRRAWDLSVQALDAGIVARITSDTPDSVAGVIKGTLPADFGAAWHLADISGDAPQTKGKWRVANCPGGPANIGGSFLAVPNGTQNARAAFQVISWMNNAENQARTYADLGNFPSTPASYKMPQLTGPVAFLGGQRAIDIFAGSAENIPVSYVSPHDATVSAPFYKELTNVEATHKDPGRAWSDAVAAAKKLCQQVGVKVS